MDKEKIKRYILDFQERDFPNLKEREIKLKESSKIQSVIGARRVGKTHLLFNKLQELKKKGIKKEQMIYLNFENPTLNNVLFNEVKEIIELHWSIFPEVTKQKLYLFIDEPQAIEKWELAIRELHDDFNCHIFITGSSSKLLSKEIATSLRGRSIATLVLPLSFQEFLTFKDFEFDKDKISSQTKAKILNYFEEFMLYGGYPEVVLENDKIEKLKISKDYYDLTIYKDIIDRYKVQNTQAIKWLINHVTNSLAKEFSSHKIYLDLKSKGIKLSKNTLYEYTSILEDSFFIFLLRRLENSSKKESLSIPKIYLNDVGFLNLFSVQDYGKRFENIFFLHLVRKKNKSPLMKINYWKASDGKEVDFLIREGGNVNTAIQVCYSLSETKTHDREINSLLSCMEILKLKEGFIITNDVKKTEKVKGKTIEFIPLWEYLLNY